jgi:curved DNA-binding protein CbpA
MLDYYNLLQVAPEASPEAIRAAYRREAKATHPDANPHGSAAEREARQRRFILLAQAYDVLSDPGRRGAYDRQWRARFGSPAGGARPRGPAPGAGRAGSGPTGGSRTSRRQPSPGPAEDIPDWNDLLHDVEDLLGQFGLNLKQPLAELLESLLEWALALFRQVSGDGGASGRTGRERPPSGARRPPPDAPPRPGRQADPEAIERELAELKRKAKRKDP